MANKRMFTQKITESDAFLEMPLSTQCLYFHLNMYGDDDGFVNNPRKVMKLIGANDDDLKLLILKSFVMVFESGVILIKHWRMHNTLKNDRYRPTDYQEEFAQVGIKGNKAYTWKDKTEKLTCKEDNKPVRHKYGEYKNVILSDEQYQKLQQEFPNEWEHWIQKVDEYCQYSGKKYNDYLATIRNWARRRKQEEKQDDTVPVYDDSNNAGLSGDELNDILREMRRT